jgi:ketosteroid isomerase-like protein
MEANMYGATRSSTVRTEVRSLLDGWVEAVTAQDLDRIMACYVDDVRAFDAIAQLQFTGRDAYREHWKICFTMCESMAFEIHDLDITAADDVAFAHYLARCGGIGPDGKEHLGWMRATVGCRKVAGRWLVTHEHYSAPFDPESGKALFDLTP